MGRAELPEIKKVFVVTAARSGSTLLRYLLDTHPDVLSPPELDFADLLHHVADTWHRTLAALGEQPNTGRAGEPPYYAPEAYERAREVVSALIDRCVEPKGARVFCDKSLTTVNHLTVASRCFPDASFVLLYRHPLDMIYSGIEASRWGYNSYGFGPYVAAQPGNLVAALANYWADQVSKMVQFERRCPGPHVRVLYEHLCYNPDRTLGQLLDFLGLDPNPGLLESAFQAKHGNGFGDYKIDYSSGVDAGPIGRGSLLPRSLLAPQIKRIDELLAELGYPLLEETWAGDLAELMGLRPLLPESSAGETGRMLDDVEGVLSRGFQAVSAQGGALPPLMDIVVSGAGRSAGAVFRLDPDCGLARNPRPDDRDRTPLRVICLQDILLQLAAGEADLGQALYDGTVRLASEGRSDAKPVSTRPEMKALGSLVRAGYRRQPI